MEKFYYDDPAGCYREGKELWRYVFSKNGDRLLKIHNIEDIIKFVNEENFRLISISTDGLGSRLKSWASVLRIDTNLKIFWHLDHPLKENNFSGLFKNSEMEVPILPPDFDFILYGGAASLLILPTDNIEDDFPSLKLQKDKIKHGFYQDEQKIDWEFERIPNSIRKEYVNMFSIIKSQVRDDILIEVDSFSNNFTDKTISVHVRSGTGFTIQCAGPPEAYLFKLDETIKVMESYSDDYTFFVSTDESVEQGSDDILSTLQEKFGNRILYHKNDSSSVRGALIDLLLLSKNKIIIGTYLSTFTEVSWWFGGATAKVIFPGWE